MDDTFDVCRRYPGPRHREDGGTGQPDFDSLWLDINALHMLLDYFAITNRLATQVFPQCGHHDGLDLM
jgi:hypothetical protein